MTGSYQGAHSPEFPNNCNLPTLFHLFIPHSAQTSAGPLVYFLPTAPPWDYLVKNMEPEPWPTATTFTCCVNSMTALSLSFFICSMGIITVPTSQPLSYALLWEHSSPATLDSTCFWFPHLCLWSICILLEQLPSASASFSFSFQKLSVQTFLQEILPLLWAWSVSPKEMV